MNTIDYYGRLLRRAQARTDPASPQVRDPFEATAPWPLDDPVPSPATAGSASPGVVLQPPRSAPVVPAPPVGEPDRKAGTRAEVPHLTSAGREPEALPSTGYGIDAAVIAHAAESANADPEHASAPETGEVPQVTLRPSIEAGSTEHAGRPGDVVVLHDRGVEGAAPPPQASDAVSAVVPLVPAAPAPLPRGWPDEGETGPPADAPAPVGASSVERDREERRPAATPPPQVIVVRERGADRWHGHAAANQDLLRGPTHQTFGIGQV